MRTLWLPLLAAGVWLLSSCGGGLSDLASNNSNGSGNGSGVGSGGTGSYTSGTISGLGSIIVNGVRYDVSQASVIDDDPGSQVKHTTSELTIGMTVEVRSGVQTPAATGSTALPTANAALVRFASALVGPVDVAPDSTCNCLTVMGQKVTYTTATNMPVHLSVSDVVEVYGRPDLANRLIVASRIVVVTDGRPYKLQGWVPASGGLDSTAKTLAVFGPSNPPDGGGQPLLLHYTEEALVSGLQNMSGHGRAVRVWFDAQQQLRRVLVEQPLVSDEDEARLDGLVTVAPNAQGQMAINGTWVHLTGAVSAPTRATLTVGTRALVEGKLTSGVLEVSEVHLGGYGGGDDDERPDAIELHGRPLNPAPLDSQRATMQVQHDEQVIAVVFKLSDAPDLAALRNMMCVEVSSQGYDTAGRLVATHVVQDNSCHDD